MQWPYVYKLFLVCQALITRRWTCWSPLSSSRQTSPAESTSSALRRTRAREIRSESVVKASERQGFLSVSALGQQGFLTKNYMFVTKTEQGFLTLLSLHRPWGGTPCLLQSFLTAVLVVLLCILLTKQRIWI